MAARKKGADSTVEDAVDAVEETGDREHRVLYNKYRPARFADVVGQDVTTSSLRAKVVAGEMPHTMLFAGPRGCGKTTSARLVAMALNCESLDDGEPCGSCDFCANVLDGEMSIGVTEVDGAQSRGIDAMQDIIRSMHVGSIARRRVFIIDEAQQLTKDASSALLKTLEEPPPGVTIILATTDPDKIQDAIRSRSSIFRFKPVDRDDMAGLVRDVAGKEGWTLTDDQVRSVVAEGRGSPRDTLSSLERIGGSEHLATSLSDFPERVCTAMADGMNVADAMVAVAEGIDQGVEAASLGSMLMTRLRDYLIALQAPELLRTADDAERDLYLDEAKRIGSRVLVRSVTTLSAEIGRMKTSADSRVLLETAIIRNMDPSTDDSVSDVLDAMDDLTDLVSDLRDEIAELRKKVDGIQLGSGSPATTSTAWPEVDKESQPSDFRDIFTRHKGDDQGETAKETPRPNLTVVQDSSATTPDDADAGEPTRSAPKEKDDRSEVFRVEGSDFMMTNDLGESMLDVIADKASARLSALLHKATATLVGNTLTVYFDGTKKVPSRYIEELEDAVQDNSDVDLEIEGAA